MSTPLRSAESVAAEPIRQARDRAVQALLAAREARDEGEGRGAGSGGWTGELSGSALSTATAVTALTFVARRDADVASRSTDYIRRGFEWLLAHQNSDGGWGDTTRSGSNISTTALVWAALGVGDVPLPGMPSATARAAAWLEREAGSLDPDVLVAAIERRYGDDRTFSIPILTMCALCGRLGPPAEAWARVQQLPFEIAALPQRWFGALQLPVVSYALPALIAMGQVRHALRPSRNPLARWLRDRARERTLRKLRDLQPENGGFLEATPLTSFVIMCLAALGLERHEVTVRGVRFLIDSARPDGNWPIDTNLATWVTSLSVQALASAPARTSLSAKAQREVSQWLSRQQHRTVHRYTLAAPGGWAWTNLPGGVPDADDTAGALLALVYLRNEDTDDASWRATLAAGVEWLLGLQNRDGGVPTFCRGWGRLPFDRSSPDITAHAIQAWSATLELLPESSRSRIRNARRRALAFLSNAQRVDGTWIPLWFGHEHARNEENPVYGTARVLQALAGLSPADSAPHAGMITRGVQALVRMQLPDGGWSAGRRESTMEETGVAVAALSGCVAQTGSAAAATKASVSRGAEWLARAVNEGRWDAAPIGLYFAKLWYFERLYPLIFATLGLTRASQWFESGTAPSFGNREV